MPQCGFSNNVVQILNVGSNFETVDILKTTKSARIKIFQLADDSSGLY